MNRETVNDKVTEFERASEEQPQSLTREFLAFLRENRKWWLAPILIVLLILQLFVLLGSTGALPFIYTLF